MTLNPLQSAAIEKALATLLNEWEKNHNSSTVVIQSSNYNIIVDSVQQIDNEGSTELGINIRIAAI